MVVELPFALKKAFVWSFWLEAGLAPEPFIFLGSKDWVMRTQLFKSCKMTPI